MLNYYVLVNYKKSNMKNLVLASISILAFLLFSCSSDDDVEELTPSVNEITYTNNIKKIMDINCISCHASKPINGAPMALVTMAQVKEAVEYRDLIGRVEDGSMPTSGEDLSTDEVQAIKDWEKSSFK